MNRNFLLDVVRIFATALVVVAHVGQRLDHWVGDGFGISNFYFVSLGGLAVSIFIILSGVVLMIGKPPSSYWSFLRKRLQRIYPTYWICLFIAVLIKVAYLLVTDSEGLFSNGGWLWNISLSVTGFYAFAGEWGGPFTATSWYIGLIVSLYLMFPFLRSMIVKAPFVTIITTFVVTLVVRLIIGGYFENSYRMLDWFPLGRVFEFTLGIYLSGVVIKRTKGIQVNKTVSKLSSWLADVSFPLFLIHYPLLYIITFLKGYIGWEAATFLYLIISFMVSHIVLIIERKLVISRFNKRKQVSQ